MVILVKLQSYEKVKAIFDAQVTLAKNWDQFIKHDWMTFSKEPDSQGTHHNDNDNIYKILVRNGHEPFAPNTSITLSSARITEYSNRTEMKVIFGFYRFVTGDQSKRHFQLSLYFNYLFFNKKDKTAGGSAFSYIWDGCVVQQTPPQY